MGQIEWYCAVRCEKAGKESGCFPETAHVIVPSTPPPKQLEESGQIQDAHIRKQLKRYHRAVTSRFIKMCVCISVCVCICVCVCARARVHARAPCTLPPTYARAAPRRTACTYTGAHMQAYTARKSMFALLLSPKPRSSGSTLRREWREAGALSCSRMARLLEDRAAICSACRGASHCPREAPWSPQGPPPGPWETAGPRAPTQSVLVAQVHHPFGQTQVNCCNAHEDFGDKNKSRRTLPLTFWLYHSFVVRLYSLVLVPWLLAPGTCPHNGPFLLVGYIFGTSFVHLYIHLKNCIFIRTFENSFVHLYIDPPSHPLPHILFCTFGGRFVQSAPDMDGRLRLSHAAAT
jgi:hypothetical protein